MTTIKEKLLSLASESEKRGLDGISVRIASLLRESRAYGLALRMAAKSDQIEIDSWPDFLGWWNNNRGQNLVYIFVDTYGGNSEQVRLVKKLVKEADKHEKDLHEFYMKLRELAGPSGPAGGEEAKTLDLGSEEETGGNEEPDDESSDFSADLDLGEEGDLE